MYYTNPVVLPYQHTALRASRENSAADDNIIPSMNLKKKKDCQHIFNAYVQSPPQIRLQKIGMGGVGPLTIAATTSFS